MMPTKKKAARKPKRSSKAKVAKAKARKPPAKKSAATQGGVRAAITNMTNVVASAVQGAVGGAIARVRGK